MVRTVYGEAAGEPDIGQQAVAHVILNRSAESGMSPLAVVSAPSQFEGYNAKAQALSPKSPAYQNILTNAVLPAVNGQSPDPTNGADHFYSPAGQAALGRKPPAWASGQPAAVIGGHQFYSLGYKGSPASTSSDPTSALPSPDEVLKHFGWSAQNDNGSAPQASATTPPPMQAMPDPSQVLATIPGYQTTQQPAPSAVPRNTPGYQAALADVQHNLQANGGNGFLGGAVRAAGQGALAGFGDELTGGINALGTAGVNALAGAGIGKKLPYTAAQSYQATVDAQRASDAAFAQAHPTTNAVAQIGGAIPSFALGSEALQGIRGTSALGRAATLGNVANAGRIGAIAQPFVDTALVAGAQGAATGAGDSQGNILQRLPGAAVGGALGSTVGVVTHGVGAAAAPLVRGAAERVGLAAGEASGKIGGMLRPNAPEIAPNPAAPPTDAESDAAKDYVSSLIAKGGATPADLAASADAAPSGEHLTTAEAAGPQGVTNLGALARQDGTTGEAVNALRARSAGSNDRILGAWQDASGIDPAAARGDIDTYVQNAKAAAQPLYDQALTGAPVMNDDLAELAKRPEIASSMKDAARLMANDPSQGPAYHTIPGEPPTPLPHAQWKPEDFESYMKTGEPPMTAGTPDQQIPSDRLWDQTKKLVQQSVAYDPVTKAQIRTGPVGTANLFYGRAAEDLTSALRDAIPGYGDALDKAGDYIRFREAAQNGVRFVNDTRTTNDTFWKLYGKLSDGEKQAFSGGFAGELSRQAEAAQLTGRKLLKSDMIQGRIRTLLGDKADGFLAHAQAETAMTGSARAIAPETGSQTTPLAAAIREQQAVPVGGKGKSGFITNALLMTHPHVLAGKLGIEGAHFVATASQRAAGAIRQSAGYRNEIGRLLLQHPRETATELETWQAARDTARQAKVSASATRVRKAGRLSLPASALANYAAGQVVQAQ